jgi:hypothetical protein
MGKIKSFRIRERKLTRMCCLIIFGSIVLGRTALGQTGASTSAMPHLEKRGNAIQLIVDDKPFLILGGELHNSSSSSVEYMKGVWPHLEAMHMNTVLLPIAWETIEPVEGEFDFRCVDGLLEGARAHNFKVVFLWFGAWKNTYSSYVPEWVKTNTDRFPRVQMVGGRSTERLSPFSIAIRDADQRAFVALMAHLRESDGQAHTVLFMQVENEVGVIPESRDHSAVADAAFEAQVPKTPMSFLEKHRMTLAPQISAAWEAAGAKSSGTWQEIFGKAPLTGDIFMAWQYATYIEHLAAAGKAEYSLPMYANAALIRPNYEPGQYNSGGLLPHSLDVWHAGAPSLDFLSPDINFNEFAEWAKSYAVSGNPLFIPEAQGGVTGAANSLYAFGRLSAIGFSPFGVDDAGNAPLDLVGVTNPTEWPDNNAIGAVYNELSRLAPMILEKQGKSEITGALMEGDAQRAARVFWGEFTANIVRVGSGTGTRVSAMFLRIGPNEFLVAGVGDAQITFSSDKPGPPIVGIVSIDEEYYENGAWVPRRRLSATARNGSRCMIGRCGVIWSSRTASTTRAFRWASSRAARR